VPEHRGLPARGDMQPDHATVSAVRRPVSSSVRGPLHLPNGDRRFGQNKCACRIGAPVPSSKRRSHKRFLARHAGVVLVSSSGSWPR
jgi:hypothetical protein